MTIIQYSVIQAIIKENFWETFDPYHICWERWNQGRLLKKVLLKVLWKYFGRIVSICLVI